VLIGAGAALLAFWVVPLLWSLVAAVLSTPRQQRDHFKEQILSERKEAAGQWEAVKRELDGERRRMLGRELRERLTIQMRLAEPIPRYIEQIPPDYPNGQRDRAAYMARTGLTQFARAASDTLRFGGQEELAAQMKLGNDDDLYSADGLRVAYEKRIKLLRPIPRLDRMGRVAKPDARLAPYIRGIKDEIAYLRLRVQELEDGELEQVYTGLRKYRRLPTTAWSNSGHLLEGELGPDYEVLRDAFFAVDQFNRRVEDGPLGPNAPWVDPDELRAQLDQAEAVLP
jgi:hypothetical protein